MNKCSKSNVKADALSGMSSALGASIGMQAGEVLSSEVIAAEVITDEVAANEVTTVEEVTEPISDSSNIIEPQVAIEPAPGPEPEQNATARPTTEVVVLDYKTIDAGNGQMYDTATVSIDGQVIYVADYDNDGVIDRMGKDENLDGELTEEEIQDVTSLGYDMTQYRLQFEQSQENLYLAEYTDYDNNADVIDYLA